MEFSEVVLSRRSIRNFKRDNISDDNIKEIIKATTYAPSSGNRQPWHFYVVKDTSIKNKIYEKACHQELIESAPILLTVCIDLNEGNKVYGERENLYNIQDTAAAIQNILLASTNLGLGSCWCGDFDEKHLKEILNMNDTRIPVAITAIGYASFEPIAPKRKPVHDIVTYIGEFKEEETENRQEKTRIAHCDMSETVFYDINLGGAVFDNVNLGGAVFNNVNFSQADISDVTMENGTVHNCNLNHLDIYDCCLEGMKINGINISDILAHKKSTVAYEHFPFFYKLKKRNGEITHSPFRFIRFAICLLRQPICFWSSTS